MNKIIRKIENSLQTDDGQRFLQYAYSFGAAIVIFGAMVKVLHWWGIWGNIIFGTGMAIECIVFILYGLDRPPKTVPAKKAVPVPQAAQNGETIRNIRPVTFTSLSPVDQPGQISDNVMTFQQEYVQQMKDLNRNISGLNTIYEIQLKSISGQLDTLDHINRGLIRIKEMYEGSVPDSSVFHGETEKMTRQIQELNQIYGRLIQAMTNTQPK
ncbi:MAG: gliding motility protein GldL [Petrimonas sp.]|nr:gliding motility protein GldL [Petrimonas sp.]